MKNVLIIQNTDYHFETLISIYSILSQLNYNPHIYRFLPDKYEQMEFIKNYGLRCATKSSINNSSCGIVISAYPNPYAIGDGEIPNSDNFIFGVFRDRLVYISHRFYNHHDYENNTINRNNTICLSPLASKINIDYINLVHGPIIPNNTYNSNITRFTIQGHFQHQNRDIELLYNLLISIPNDKKAILNIIGTGITPVYQLVMKLNLSNLIVRPYENITESNLYSLINNETDWIVPLINPSIKNHTYLRERYSSNFNHAFMMEKPIICHESLKNIYEIPGIYFTDNISEVVIDACNYSNHKYNDLVKSFADVKTTLMNHNKQILDLYI